MIGGDTLPRNCIGTSDRWCGGAVGRVNMVENYIAYLGLRRGKNNAKSNIREQRLGQLSGVKIRQSEHGN